MDVMAELKPIGVLYSGGQFDIGLQRLRELWAEIPEPKIDASNAYLVIEYGVALALKIEDLDEAQRWAALAPQFAQKRQDMGEVEFLVGRVAFERGELDIARDNFLIASRKSGGRAFINKDAKYRKLIA